MSIFFLVFGKVVVTMLGISLLLEHAESSTDVKIRFMNVEIPFSAAA